VEQIETGVKWALEQHKQRPVLFHCAHGHGRSNVLMCATLIQLGRASTAQDALAIVKEARPRVKLNKPQLAAVEKWIQKRQTSLKAD
jgi:protein-tyrosine phosphatase